MTKVCPKCREKYSFFNLLTQPMMCGSCFRAEREKSKTEEQVKINDKPFSLNKLILDLLGLLAGGLLCYWMYTRFENFEQWFDGRRSDGYGFLFGLFIITVSLWDIIRNLYKLIKAKKFNDSDT
ncbi:hypothetical protein [uncultured Paraglaciecola sp.]|uniref:hypothetical protein n=1 Tax=uncultured Paraglaciecola sp. TaxID=1765024 RepID=UPI002594B008|nr:hypothetical protein [uncultured Paraglaciecola sp.]